MRYYTVALVCYIIFTIAYTQTYYKLKENVRPQRPTHSLYADSLKMCAALASLHKQVGFSVSSSEPLMCYLTKRFPLDICDLVGCIPVLEAKYYNAPLVPHDGEDFYTLRNRNGLFYKDDPRRGQSFHVSSFIAYITKDPVTYQEGQDICPTGWYSLDGRMNAFYYAEEVFKNVVEETSVKEYWLLVDDIAMEGVYSRAGPKLALNNSVNTEELDCVSYNYDDNSYTARNCNETFHLICKTYDMIYDV